MAAIYAAHPKHVPLMLVGARSKGLFSFLLGKSTKKEPEAPQEPEWERERRMRKSMLRAERAGRRSEPQLDRFRPSETKEHHTEIRAAPRTQKQRKELSARRRRVLGIKAGSNVGDAAAVSQGKEITPGHGGYTSFRGGRGGTGALTGAGDDEEEERQSAAYAAREAARQQAATNDDSGDATSPLLSEIRRKRRVHNQRKRDDGRAQNYDHVAADGY